MGVNLNNNVGQGYNGAAVMSEKYKEVHKLISEKYPKKQFVHCSAHLIHLDTGQILWLISY